MNTLILGVGGAGTNIVVMASQRIPDSARFLVANTDMASLRRVEQKHPNIRTLPLGVQACQGSGAAGAVQLGRKSALDSQDAIKAELERTDNLLLVAGLGGGTGTGAAVVFTELGLQLCRSVSALVIKPFAFEEEERMAQAEQCIQLLKEQIGEVWVIDNEAEMQSHLPDQNLADFFDTLNGRLVEKLESLLLQFP